MSKLVSSAAMAMAALVFSGSTSYAKTVVGKAVYYSDKMDGTGVSLKGEKYQKDGMTAATHRGFPLGSNVKVTNLRSGKSVVLKVNDRMNPKSSAVIDVSHKAAEELGMIAGGHARVKVESVASK